MPPAIAAAGIAAAATVGSAVIGSGAAKKAANAQRDAAQLAADTQNQMFDKQTALQEPFRQTGITANNRLMDLLGISENAGQRDYGKYAGDFGMADFQQDPGYAFRLSEGMKALNNSFAAQGKGISGANLKAAVNYGQQAGSQEYQNAFNRYQVNRSNQLNPLQSLAGAGQTATNALTGAAGDVGRGVADTQLQGGNARASGYVGQANALTSALSGGANSYLGYQAQQPLNNYLNSMTNNGWAMSNSYSVPAGLYQGQQVGGFVSNPDYSAG